MTRMWLALLVLCIFSAVSAHADRDIVYAARYYAPPGSHRTSHFHLYRINPDGTGKTQLTFGSADDNEPVWSPDGKHVAFARNQNAVYVMSSGGKGLKRLIRLSAKETLQAGPEWLPDSRTVMVVCDSDDGNGGEDADPTAAIYFLPARLGRIRRIPNAAHYLLSLDRRLAYIKGIGSDRLLNCRTGATVSVRDPVQFPVWQSNLTLMGMAQKPPTYLTFLRFIGADGREKRHLPVKPPPDSPASRYSLVEDYNGGLSRIPQSRFLLYALNNTNSTVPIDSLFYRLDPVTGAMTHLTEGQFAAWSPDGTRFCTAPGRGTTPYEKQRTVWNAPLSVHATAGGPMRQLTPRLSWVTAADWRKRE